MPTFSSHSALPPTRWAVPLLRLGGFQIQASYGILIGAIGLTLFAVSVSRSAGNADLPRVVALGALFWTSGWLVQSVTFLATSRLMGSPAGELCLGVLGVELGPRRWPARHALLIALATIVSIIVLGSFYRLVEGGFRYPQIIRSDQSIWSAPSIGFTKHDSIWQSAAWLCWAQTVLQLYPLPRTMGRQIVGALTSISTGKMELPVQVAVFRRCLGATALLTIGIAIASVMTGTSFFGVHGLVFLVLGADALDLITELGPGPDPAGHRLPNEDDSSGQVRERGRLGPHDVGLGIRDSIHRWRTRRRLRTAQRREQGEAIDVQRVDEILARLHQEGMESLSPEDRRILARVSESLRRERRDGSLGDPRAD